jgi:hypothetical protein
MGRYGKLRMADSAGYRRSRAYAVQRGAGVLRTLRAAGLRYGRREGYIHAQEMLLQPLLRHGDLREHGHFAPILLTPDERKLLANGCTDSIAQINLLQDLSNSLDSLYASVK